MYCVYILYFEYVKRNINTFILTKIRSTGHIVLYIFMKLLVRIFPQWRKYVNTKGFIFNYVK
jgi:hypothetical protein